MNILILNYEYPPLGGGGGIFSRDLAEEMALSHRVDVLTTSFKGLKKQETVGGVNITRVPVIGRSSLYTGSLPSLLSFPFPAITKGLSMILRNKYDIINTHFAVPTGPAGMTLSRLTKTPNVLTVHGGDLYKPGEGISPHKHALTRWAVRQVATDADAVVAQSTNTRNNALELYGLKRDIDIIPLGIPFPHFSHAEKASLFLKEDVTYLISIGRLIKRKGYDTLIKALDLAHRRGHKLGLVLVGEGPEREALEKLTADLDLAEYVYFAGSVSEDNKFRYLAASDMYVLSSLHEGFGIVLLEAMMCSLPIIATNVGGQTDIVKEERNGLLVNPEDAEALAEAIITIASDDEKRSAIGATNKNDVTHYSIPEVAKRYLGLFEKVITEKGKKK